MLLQRVTESELVGSEIVQLVDELCSTLYCHCGKYLLSHHDEVLSQYTRAAHVNDKMLHCIVIIRFSMCDSCSISNGS